MITKTENEKLEFIDATQTVIDEVVEPIIEERMKAYHKQFGEFSRVDVRLWGSCRVYWCVRSIDSQRTTRREYRKRRTMKYKPIKCKHETENIPISETLDDHHPLTANEIKKLLERALVVRGSAVRFSEIQCRLIQGVPGITCPHPVHGVVAQKVNHIEKEFQNIDHENIDRMVKLFDLVMNGYGATK